MRSLAFAAAVAALVPAAASGFQKLTDVELEMDDGVVLRSDVYLPTAPDRDGDGRYPCVVELTPYRKESRAAEGASDLPGRGVALIEVDARGTGGSEGEYDIVFSVREQADAVAWIEWAATAARKPDGTPLCEETVGMYGGSYSGIIQYLVASLPLGAGDVGYGRLPAGSPHLAAIAPQRAYGDLYRDIVYHGGQLIGSFGLLWSGGTSALYAEPPANVAAPGGRSAWIDHLLRNDPLVLFYLNAPYADSLYTSDDTTPPYSQRLYEDSSVLSRIENLRVPALHLAGWFDAFTRGQLLAFQEAHALEVAAAADPAAPRRGPNFLVIGPWNHAGTHFVSPDQGFEELLGDWYLYWLEGAANGASPPAWIASGLDGRGARVQYFQMRSALLNAQSEADGQWRFARTWPPEVAEVRRLYLRSGGRLSALAPEPGEGADFYLYDPGAGTAEILSRWDNAAGTPQPQWDQRLDSFKGLSYRSEPFEQETTVTGPIVLRLFASTLGVPGEPALATSWPGAFQAEPPYHDTDWVAKVSDVAPDGSTRLLTQGYLRASHRAVDPERSRTIGGEILVPYHPHTLAALDPPLPGEIREYLVEVWPTSKIFEPGHRIELDLYSADTPNHLNLAKPALNAAFHEPGRASYLALPISPSP